jgi:hypothetical protein
MDNLRELLGLDNHYKLIATASWAFGLVGTVHFVRAHAPFTFILAWTSLTFVAPYGLKGLTAWLNRRGAEAEIGAIRDESKAIIERRASGDGTFEPTE